MNGKTSPTGGTPPFDTAYYQEQGLQGDRLALWYYSRVARRLFRRNGSVFDFGCGTGHLLKRLSRNFQAYGYDVSGAARAQCRENAPDAVVLEEWESIAPATFDGVIALHSFEHIPRPMTVVSGLADRLVAQGRMLVVVPNTGGLGRRLKGPDWFAYRDPTHCSLLSRGEWATLLRRVGLRILWIRGDGMWDAPYVRWVPAVAQRPIFTVPAAVQVLYPVAKPFLPSALGECLIIAAERE